MNKVSPKLNDLGLTNTEFARIQVEALDFTARSLQAEFKSGHYPIAIDDPASPIAPIQIVSPAAAVAAAATVRQRWNLGDWAIKSLISVFEENGIKVLRTNLGQTGEGFTMWLNEGGRDKVRLIIIGRYWTIERMRYTLAHQLGQILDRTATAENRHLFAMALLMPEAPLKARYENALINLETLAAIRREFGVSSQTALDRLNGLRLISNEIYQELRAASKGNLEYLIHPLVAFDETPNRLEALCTKALRDSSISAHEAAELRGA